MLGEDSKGYRDCKDGNLDTCCLGSPLGPLAFLEYYLGSRA